MYNVCYTFALYGMLLFWIGAAELLEPFNPLLKFVLVKTVVFLTFWQVGVLARGTGRGGGGGVHPAVHRTGPGMCKADSGAQQATRTGMPQAFL
jgi:hypothetical protein